MNDIDRFKAKLENLEFMLAEAPDTPKFNQLRESVKILKLVINRKVPKVVVPMHEFTITLSIN